MTILGVKPPDPGVDGLLPPQINESPRPVEPARRNRGMGGQYLAAPFEVVEENVERPAAPRLRK